MAFCVNDITVSYYSVTDFRRLYTALLVVVMPTQQG